jgi:hypothetical protein
MAFSAVRFGSVTDVIISLKLSVVVMLVPVMEVTWLKSV